MGLASLHPLDLFLLPAFLGRVSVNDQRDRAAVYPHAAPAHRAVYLVVQQADLGQRLPRLLSRVERSFRLAFRVRQDICVDVSEHLALRAIPQLALKRCDASAQCRDGRGVLRGARVEKLTPQGDALWVASHRVTKVRGAIRARRAVPAHAGCSNSDGRHITPEASAAAAPIGFDFVVEHDPIVVCGSDDAGQP